MHLKTANGKYDGPTNTPVEAVVRVAARKVWTVPSGGNFVAPIMVGTMVNVTALPGAAIEIIGRREPSASPGVPHTGTGAGAAHVP